MSAAESAAASRSTLKHDEEGGGRTKRFKSSTPAKPVTKIASEQTHRVVTDAQKLSQYCKTTTGNI